MSSGLILVSFVMLLMNFPFAHSPCITFNYDDPYGEFACCYTAENLNFCSVQVLAWMFDKCCNRCWPHSGILLFSVPCFGVIDSLMILCMVFLSICDQKRPSLEYCNRICGILFRNLFAPFSVLFRRYVFQGSLPHFGTLWVQFDGF